MADQYIVDLITRQLASGESVEKVQKGLLAKGYAPEDINGAFAFVRLHDALPLAGVVPHALPEVPQQRGSRMFFGIAVCILLLGVGAAGYVTYARVVDASALERVRALIQAKEAALLDRLYPFSLPAGQLVPWPVAPAPLAATSSPAPSFTRKPANPVKTTTPAAKPSYTAPTVAPPTPTVVSTPTPTPTPAVVSTPNEPVVTTSLPTPTVSLRTDLDTVGTDTPITLTWSSTDATSCTGTGFVAGGVNGSADIVVNVSYVFKITCANAAHDATASVSVTVVDTTDTAPSDAAG
jgi:hypothetical protein